MQGTASLSGEAKASSSIPARAVFYGGLLALAIGLVLFLREAVVGLQLFEFGDETEKFVTAQLINEGLRLYRDIFAHHGPLSYIIAHLYSVLVSRSDFTSIRFVQVGLALLSAAAIFITPVLRSMTARTWSVGAYLFLLSTVWLVQGMHMLLYQQIGGFLLVIAFVHLFVPLFFGVRPHRQGVFAAGFAVVASCFCAYSFGPATVLLTLASVILLGRTVKRQEWGHSLYPFLLGVLAAVSFTSLWMLLFADFKGFYIYHFFFNQHVYTLFFHYSFRDVLQIFSLSFAPHAVVHTVVLALFGSWAVFLAASIGKGDSDRTAGARPLALLLGIASVCFMNPRGWNGIHDNGFIVINFALFALIGGLVVQHCLDKDNLGRLLGAVGGMLLPFLLIVAGSKDVLSSPHGFRRDEWRNQRVSVKPEEGGYYELIRSLTSRDRDFLSLVFNPIHYIKADRLPASGQFYYLPWQAAYNMKPKAGYRINICQDIRSRAPSLILFDDMKVSGFLRLKQYQPCVLAEIAKNYVPLGRNSKLFARRERIVGDIGKEGDETVQMRLGPPLSASVPIPVRMTPGHQGYGGGLKRIGVRFGNVAPRAGGEAELRLKGPDGKVISQRFSLADLVDNSYRYFDLDAKIYTAGEIVSLAGSGISAWENWSGQGTASTCITYEYADGRRGFTPGCPLF